MALSVAVAGAGWFGCRIALMAKAVLAAEGYDGWLMIEAGRQRGCRASVDQAVGHSARALRC